MQTEHMLGFVARLFIHGALGAQADKFQAVAHDGVDRAAVKVVFQGVQGGNGGIIHLIAIDATDMVMFLGNPVIAFLAAAEFQGLNFAQGGQNFKVAIDGAQTDAWQALAHHLIQGVCRWMDVFTAQDLQNDLALFGKARFAGGNQILICPFLLWSRGFSPQDRF